MQSPIKTLVDMVKDRDLKQKALSDRVGSTAPIKIPSAFIACKKVWKKGASRSLGGASFRMSSLRKLCGGWRLLPFGKAL